MFIRSIWSALLGSFVILGCAVNAQEAAGASGELAYVTPEVQLILTPERPNVSSPPPNASWRYGGGGGFPDLVYESTAIVVRSAAELEAALQQAVTGDVVFIPNDVSIDLTGRSLCIPGGVTLASHRGRNGEPGAKLFTTTLVAAPMLAACGDDVRITGLRLIGPDPSMCAPGCPSNRCFCREWARAVQVVQQDRLEVDNCEIAAWGYAGVFVQDSFDNHIHHNYIHHIQTGGTGYGVVFVRGGQALIEYNRFDYNRHSVAGTGEPGQDYEARYNLALPRSSGHVFDMHGENETLGNGSPYAGGEILVHHNTVLTTTPTTVVRGRPSVGAWTYSNCVAQPSAVATRQEHYSGNFFVDRSPTGAAPNRYAQTPQQCEAVRWCTSSGGDGPWTYAAASGYTLADLAFGNFVGDARVDVFRADGTYWWTSDAGHGSWQRINSSSERISNLRFDDFNGDGRTDVFTVSRNRWLVSYGGAAAWVQINSSSYPLSSLSLADCRFAP